MSTADDTGDMEDPGGQLRNILNTVLYVQYVQKRDNRRLGWSQRDKRHLGWSQRDKVSEVRPLNHFEIKLAWDKSTC